MQTYSRRPERPLKPMQRLYPNAAIPTPRDTEKTNKLGAGSNVTSFRSRLFGNGGQVIDTHPSNHMQGDDQDGGRVPRPFPLYLPEGAGQRIMEKPRQRSFLALFEQGRATKESCRETHQRGADSHGRTKNLTARAQPSPLLRRVLEPQRLGLAGDPQPKQRLFRGSMYGKSLLSTEHENHTATPPRQEATLLSSVAEVPRQLPDSGAESMANLKDRYCELGAALHAEVSAALDDSHAALAERVSGIFLQHESFLSRHDDLTADFSQPLSESYVFEQVGASPREKIFVRDVAAELRTHLAEMEKTLAADWERWDECRAAEEKAAATLLDDLRTRPDAGGSLGCEVKKWEAEMEKLTKDTGDKFKQLEQAWEKEYEKEIQQRVKLYERTLRQTR